MIYRKRLGLVPLENFGWIDGNIWRSAQPKNKFEYKWLEERIGVGLIVNLREESIQGGKGVPILNIPVKDHNPPTISQAKDFIHVIKKTKGNILIHCLHGHGRTSTFSVLAKIALGWTLEEAIVDEKKRFHINFQHHMQEEFLRKNFK